MKRKILLAVVVLFVMSTGAFAAMLPVDGDAWTEDSLTGWTSSATPVFSDKRLVGDNSISSGMMNGDGALTINFDTPIDASDANAKIHFWLRNESTDPSYNLSCKIYSEGNPGFAYFDWINLNNVYGFYEFTFDINTMPTWDGAFDSSKINQVTWGLSWHGTDVEMFVDNLYFENASVVPEPATLSLLVAGFVTSLIKRKRNK